MSHTQKVKRLRFVTTVPPKSEVRLVHEDTEVSFVPMEAIGEDGQIQTDRTKRIGEVMNGYTYFGEGDVVMAKITPCFENGKGAIASQLVNGIGFGTTELHVLRAERGLDSRFLFYVTKSHDFRKLGEGEMYGAGGQKRVPESFVRDFRAFVPSMEEQRATAEFLDRETSLIDKLIGQQKRLISSLKEKREAVVYRFVTRGLNPVCRLKASGIEWLGEVPHGWEIHRLGTLFREACDAGNDDLPILSVSIHDGVSDKQLADDELDRKVARSEDTSKYKKVLPSDLVYNMMRAWQGGFGAVTVPGMVSPAYVVARPKRPIITKFIELLLRTPSAIEEMRRHSYGVADFRLRLYWDHFKTLQVALPPLVEQRRIVKAAQRETESIDALVGKITGQNEKLAEYRSALISAAVTGQIDVRTYPQEAAVLCQ